MQPQSLRSQWVLGCNPPGMSVLPSRSATKIKTYPGGTRVVVRPSGELCMGPRLTQWNTGAGCHSTGVYRLYTDGFVHVGKCPALFFCKWAATFWRRPTTCTVNNFKKCRLPRRELEGNERESVEGGEVSELVDVVRVNKNSNSRGSGRGQGRCKRGRSLEEVPGIRSGFQHVFRPFLCGTSREVPNASWNRSPSPHFVSTDCLYQLSASGKLHFAFFQL